MNLANSGADVRPAAKRPLRKDSLHLWRLCRVIPEVEALLRACPPRLHLLVKFAAAFSSCIAVIFLLQSQKSGKTLQSRNHKVREKG
ncbi:hypothetical protein [Mixta gaviniae]|uniref:Uncharacterized protein n=1 Tax=Mixta gaviniae TaxID=665914 RepID=A0A1X1ED51_9GAMM|nr:hypothetical protein [Mixta gaviniae]AUX93801.1 hypothetical protein C2E15_12430 [Mixta gaviniae]ORM86868.1 hypothetical protein HA44_02330 [Mixta gaviniae]